MMFAGLVSLLVGVGMLILFDREPSYQGKPLTGWLDDLAENRPAVNRAAATEAIRQLGPKSVPHLLALLKARSSPVRFQDFLDHWLMAHPQLRIDLGPEKDRSWQVVEAFEILGPVGEPAMPGLVKLLNHQQTCGQAAECLAAIGPPAVPLLAGALTTTNREMQTAVLLAVGEIGPAARPALPALMAVLPALERENMAVAAFALARIGPESVPVLLRALTNENAVVRQVILTALDPKFRAGAAAIKWPDQKFSSVMTLANLQRQPENIAHILLANFNNTNAAVRVEVIRAWCADGLPATLLKARPVLANALNDENAEVRRLAEEALKKIDFEFREGGVVRGSKAKKQIALAFTGHTFGEGGETILNELARHHAKGSFFLTGEFLGRREFEPLIERILREGHYLGPHSDQHLLYCPWDGPKKTLVSSNEFSTDLLVNVLKIRHFSDAPLRLQYWLPAYEWYNQEIMEWSGELGLTLVNYTPGTRSNADYTQERDPNFVPSQAIYESIVKKEREDPHGLNGFLLLLHLGAGPGRADKMHARFGELLDYLAAKGYQFVRVDELLDLK